jgi:hypothetical protein
VFQNWMGVTFLNMLGHPGLTFIVPHHSHTCILFTIHNYVALSVNPRGDSKIGVFEFHGKSKYLEVSLNEEISSDSVESL